MKNNCKVLVGVKSDALYGNRAALTGRITAADCSGHPGGGGGGVPTAGVAHASPRRRRVEQRGLCFARGPPRPGCPAVFPRPGPARRGRGQDSRPFERRAAPGMAARPLKSVLLRFRNVSETKEGLLSQVYLRRHWLAHMEPLHSFIAILRILVIFID